MEDSVRKSQSKNYVHVQCSVLHDMDGERDFRTRTVMAIPVSTALRLLEVGILHESSNQAASVPLVLDPEFDDCVFSIPGAFIVRS